MKLIPSTINTHSILYETLCTIWYHLQNLKNAKNTHGGVLLLVLLKETVSMGVFYVFKISQMVPNPPKHYTKLHKIHRETPVLESL